MQPSASTPGVEPEVQRVEEEVGRRPHAVLEERVEEASERVPVVVEVRETDEAPRTRREGRAPSPSLPVPAPTATYPVLVLSFRVCPVPLSRSSRVLGPCLPRAPTALATPVPSPRCGFRDGVDDPVRPALLDRQQDLPRLAPVHNHDDVVPDARRDHRVADGYPRVKVREPLRAPVEFLLDVEGVVAHLGTPCLPLQSGSRGPFRVTSGTGRRGWTVEPLREHRQDVAPRLRSRLQPLVTVQPPVGQVE